MNRQFPISITLSVLAITACHSASNTSPAPGTAAVAWSIVQLGRPATCAQVGATTVAVQLHNRSSGADTTTTLACTDTQGTSSAVASGTYDATITLTAIDGAPIATATQTAVAIESDQVTTLVPVTFAAGTLGKLALSITTIGTSSNCQPHDQGGAAITANEMTLVHAAGGCAPVTLIRSRGGVIVGSYTINCSSPQVASCIERDETLTIDALDAGPYLFHVSALIGATACWDGIDTLSVPSGATLDQRIQLAPTQAPRC